MATIRNVISYVDAIKPNAFDEGVKVQWVNEVEGYIQTEVMMLALADTVQYDPDVHMDTVLLVKPPHDKLYSLYLCALVDFANGEYDKYNNTMQMYNKFLGEYIKWYTRVFHPADGGCVREGYYLSAYTIATRHGFEGNEEEWLESLKGNPGEPFEYDDFTQEQLEALRGPAGRDIVSVERTSGDGTAGSVDAYTITYSSGPASKFEVRNGSDGITPHIGSNGNWYIGDTDTGIQAQGEPGKDGQDGQPGEKGESGESGVYVGSGDMPDGYNVQIDPDGEVFEVDDIVSLVLDALPTWEGGSY